MISEIIKLNQEVDNFVKAQKNVLSSYASENVLTNREKILIKSLKNNLNALTYKKNKILALNDGIDKIGE